MARLNISWPSADPSPTAVGAHAPPGLQTLALAIGPDETFESYVARFSASVSAFYPSLAVLPEGDVEPLRAPLSDPPPTTVSMSPEELRETTHPEVLRRSQYLIRALDPAAYRACVERAFFYSTAPDVAEGAGEQEGKEAKGGKEVWPALRVHVVWCAASVGDCVWASGTLLRGMKDPRWSLHAGLRPLEFHRLEGANHFVSLLVGSQRPRR